MLSKRIIACLDVRDGQVVKGINFEGLRSAGDPAELARRYNVEGIDELVILDITATLERRRALADTIRAVARELFIPLAVGGGIRTEDDAAAAVDAGADKVSLNTAALVEPAAHHDARQPLRQPGRHRRDRRQARVDASGSASPSTRAAARRAADRDAVEWAREAEARGAGEILLTSIDRDGTKAGFDCEMTAAVSTARCRFRSSPRAAPAASTTSSTSSPRGAADAALAASIFHYAETSVHALKQHLRAARHPGAAVINMHEGRDDTSTCPRCLLHRAVVKLAYADSRHRSQGRRRRAARAGRAPGDPRRRRVPLGEAVRALPEGAGHRSRRRDGQSATTSRSSGRSPARCPAAWAAASGRVERARDILAAGAQQVIAGSALFRDGRPDLDVRRRAGRRRRRRAGHRRGRQPRRPGRDSRLEDDSAADARSTPSGRSSRTAASSSTPTSTPKG